LPFADGTDGAYVAKMTSARAATVASPAAQGITDKKY
jgi:hypothetical protein